MRVRWLEITKDQAEKMNNPPTVAIPFSADTFMVLQVQVGENWTNVPMRMVSRPEAVAHPPKDHVLQNSRRKSVPARGSRLRTFIAQTLGW